MDTPQGLRAALARGPWELIISDSHLPRFSGEAALGIVRESQLDPPFFIVSGTVGEETAAESMRSGARDYLVKGRLARLVPAVERELREASVRRAHRTTVEALGRRDAILKAVLVAAEQLLRNRDLEAGTRAVLQVLGEALRVSRIFLCENHVGEDGELLTSLRHEWLGPDLAARARGPERLAFGWRAGGFERWEAALARGETLHGFVRDLPASEQAFLQALGIRTFACVPIHVGSNWWGVLGFDDMTADREWSSAEIDALKTAADTLGAAIQRRLVEEQVERQVRRLGGLRAINVAITASLDLSVTLNVLLDEVMAQLGVDAANVLLLRPQTRTLEFAASRGFRADAFRYTRLALGEGYAGLAALERRTIAVPDLGDAPGGLGRAAYAVGERFVAYVAIPLLSKGQVKGVLELFHRSSLDSSTEWTEFAQTLASQAAVAIDNALLFDDLQRSNVDLGLAYDTTLEGWSRALDLRDRETEGHTRRVTDLTLRLARKLDMRDAELVHVRRGALLHDIGKMGIPDRILLKPGPLDEAEWAVMRLHPVYAFELLAPIPYLRPALDIPYAHHERWDGTGYPRGLRDEMIPLAARVFAVVDVWDALCSDRPYRRAWPEGRVVDHIRDLSGSHFDPTIVGIFLAELPVALRAAQAASV